MFKKQILVLGFLALLTVGNVWLLSFEQPSPPPWCPQEEPTDRCLREEQRLCTVLCKPYGGCEGTYYWGVYCDGGVCMELWDLMCDNGYVYTETCAGGNLCAK
jgi:hypothetical protein